MSRYEQDIISELCNESDSIEDFADDYFHSENDKFIEEDLFGDDSEPEEEIEYLPIADEELNCLVDPYDDDEDIHDEENEENF